MLLDTEWWTYNVCPGSITSWHYQASVETFINPGLSLKNIIELLIDSEWWSHESFFISHSYQNIPHRLQLLQRAQPLTFGRTTPKSIFCNFPSWSSRYGKWVSYCTQICGYFQATSSARAPPPFVRSSTCVTSIASWSASTSVHTTSLLTDAYPDLLKYQVSPTN